MFGPPAAPSGTSRGCCSPPARALPSPLAAEHLDVPDACENNSSTSSTCPQWPSPAGIEARGCLVTAAALRVPDHTGSTPLWRHRIGRLVKDAVRRGEDSPFAAPGLHRRSRRTREALYATHLPWDPHHVSAAPGIEAMRVHHVADDEEASAMASAGLPTALGGRATRVDVAGEPRSSSDEESGPGFGSGGFLFGRDGARRRMAAAREEESEVGTRVGAERARLCMCKTHTREPSSTMQCGQWQVIGLPSLSLSQALRATLHLFQAVDEVVALLHALAAANPRALGRVAGSLHLGNRMRGAEMSGGGAAQGQTGAGPREMGDGVEKGRGVSSAKRKRGGVPENVGLEHEARGVLQERVRDREETGIDVRSGGDAGVVGVNASGADGMGEGAADANAGAGKGRALLLRRLGERRGKQGAAAGVAGDSKRGAATLRAGADVADATKGAGVATEGPGVQGSAGDGRWHQAVDVGSGHMYYYNERLGITQWEEPAGAQVVPLAEGWRRWLAERWAWGSLEVPKHGGGENGDGEAQAARLPRPETSGLLCGEHARGSGVHVRFGSDGESDEGENVRRAMKRTGVAQVAHDEVTDRCLRAVPRRATWMPRRLGLRTWCVPCRTDGCPTRENCRPWGEDLAYQFPFHCYATCKSVLCAFQPPCCSALVQSRCQASRGPAGQARVAPADQGRPRPGALRWGCSPRPFVSRRRRHGAVSRGWWRSGHWGGRREQRRRRQRARRQRPGRSGGRGFAGGCRLGSGRPPPCCRMPRGASLGMAP